MRMQVLALVSRIRDLLMGRKIKPDLDDKFETHFNPLVSGTIQWEMTSPEGDCVTESRLAP